MKITFVITLYLGLFSFTTFGQQVKISEKLKFEHGEFVTGHLVSNEHGHFFKAENFTEHFFQKYDKNLALKFSYQYRDKESDTEPFDFIKMKSGIGMLTITRDKKADLISYHIVPLDYNGKTEKPFKIAQFSYEQRSDRPKATFTSSADTSTYSFLYYFDNNEDDVKFSLYASIMKNDGTNVWNKRVNLPYSQENIEILNASINNDGKLAILLKQYEGVAGKKLKKVKKVNGEDKPAYKIKLITIQGDKDGYEEIELAWKSDFLVEGALRNMANGDFGLIGLFSGSKKLLTNGVISLKINCKTNEVYQSVKKEFSSSEIDMLDENKNTSKHKDEEGLKSSFKMINYSVLQDGSAFVTLENNYIHQSTTTFYNGRNVSQSSITYFVSRDAIVLIIDKEGNITKMNIVPKVQSFAEIDLYNSSLVLVNEDGLNLFYNEDKDNLNTPIEVKKTILSNAKDCVLVNVHVARDGKMTRQSLYDRNDSKAVFIPKFSNAISKNQIAFVALKQGLLTSTDRRIGLITLGENK